jgi:hypothetical protein
MGMKPLERIFKTVVNDWCHYFECEEYRTFSEDAAESQHLVGRENIFGNECFILAPDELLVIENDQETREKVSIGSFPRDGECRIYYMGDSTRKMWDTIVKLRLPSFSENLGELAFHIFQGHLKELKDSDEMVGLELKRVSGEERQFLLVIMKLLRVFEGKQIDSEFYQEYKSCRKRFANCW